MKMHRRSFLKWVLGLTIVAVVPLSSSAVETSSLLVSGKLPKGRAGNVKKNSVNVGTWTSGNNVASWIPTEGEGVDYTWEESILGGGYYVDLPANPNYLHMLVVGVATIEPPTWLVTRRWRANPQAEWQSEELVFTKTFPPN